MAATEFEAVGERIRTLRTAAGLSLSALAAQAGIGKGSLSELESGRRNPTLGTLYAVAGPLGVPLAELLADRDGAVAADDGVTATRVRVLREAGRTTEVYLLRLAPYAVRTSPAHSAGVTERLVLLTGEGTVEVDASVSPLAIDAEIVIDADRPHAYRAGPAGFEAVDVIVTPR